MIFPLIIAGKDLFIRILSFLVMSIVGGAIFPVIMGRIADVSTMAPGFIVPLVCFAFIFYFGVSGYKVRVR